MALQVEGVVDGGMDAEKSLCGAGRFEPLHFPLPPSHNLVSSRRDCSCAALAHDGRSDELPERGGTGGHLVGNRALRRKALLPEQFAHQPHGRAFIAARLDQQIEDFALLVDGTP